MRYPAYPRYTDSGIDWLGRIPEHWELKRIRYIFYFLSGGTPSTENLEYWVGDIPWLSSKEIKLFRIDDTEEHISEIALGESTATLVPKGTMVVVMRSGILLHSIPCSIVQREMAINQDLKAFVPQSGSF